MARDWLHIFRPPTATIHVLLIEIWCKFDDRLWPYKGWVERTISDYVGKKTCCFLWFSISGNLRISHFLKSIDKASFSLMNILNHVDINLSHLSLTLSLSINQLIFTCISKSINNYAWLSLNLFFFLFPYRDLPVVIPKKMRTRFVDSWLTEISLFSDSPMRRYVHPWDIQRVNIHPWEMPNLFNSFSANIYRTVQILKLWWIHQSR